MYLFLHNCSFIVLVVPSLYQCTRAVYVETKTNRFDYKADKKTKKIATQSIFAFEYVCVRLVE